MAQVDQEKDDSYKVFVEVCEKSDQLMIRFNVAIVGRNWVEKFARALMTEFVHAVDAVVPQLVYYTVGYL